MSTVLYATDEDIALRVPSDFAMLCPKDQKLAWGSDGAFLISDPWTLFSASVAFSAQGLAPGQVVQLTKPISQFKPPGEILVVQSVAGNALALRRRGQQSGLGQPPGTGAGAVAVEFLVTTLGPQIEAASYELNRRYGIDDLVSGRRVTDMYDQREVREAVVLMVLQQRYLDLSREAGRERDIFAEKADLAKAALDDLLARVVIHWYSTGTSTSRFSTRITR